MNDRERELWIMNDERLYLWWKGSGKGITTFIRTNRAAITRRINHALNQEPAR